MEFDNFSKFLIIEMSLFTFVKKNFFGEVMKIDKNLGASSKFSQLSIFLSFIPQEKKNVAGKNSLQRENSFIFHFFLFL